MSEAAPFRTGSVDDVIADIQFALDGGVKEIVHTGVHLGSWGYEFDKHLTDLIKAILSDTDVPRLRLSSLEPWDLSPGFFSLWANQRLIPHLHLPLQSGSESTLKRMRRNTTPQSFRELVSAARAFIPDVAITTDIIAGFPGETEAEKFEETLHAVETLPVTHLHVFPFSARPGTRAAGMADDVPPALKKDRVRILRRLGEAKRRAFQERFLGTVHPELTRWLAEQATDTQGDGQRQTLSLA